MIWRECLWCMSRPSILKLAISDVDGNETTLYFCCYWCLKKFVDSKLGI
jgi:hypothetical protein